MEATTDQFIIVGGGIAGLCATIALQKIGITAQLYEGAKELKGIGAGFGLAANAMQALALLDLREDITKLGHFLDSYNVLDEQGNILVAPDTQSISSNYNQDNFAIHRADLHQLLLSKIPTGQIHLGKKALSFSKQGGLITVHFADGTSTTGTALLVADGVHSSLRQQLVPSSAPRYSGYTCWRAIIDNSSLQLKKSTETWGKKGRFGMTPLVGNRIYWYACVNSTAQNPIMKNWTIDDLLHNFANYHDPIPSIIKETAEKDLLWNDIIDIAPLSQLAYDNILLLGDAGHATTPNLGQGACQAIEDVAVLIDELKKQKPLAETFKQVEKRRIARVNYICNTSWRIGKIAQWDNSILIAVRNFIMQIMPEKLKQRQINRLLSVDFMKINTNEKN